MESSASERNTGKRLFHFLLFFVISSVIFKNVSEILFGDLSAPFGLSFYDLFQSDIFFFIAMRNIWPAWTSTSAGLVLFLYVFGFFLMLLSVTLIADREHKTPPMIRGLVWSSIYFLPGIINGFILFSIIYGINLVYGIPK